MGWTFIASSDILFRMEIIFAVMFVLGLAGVVFVLFPRKKQEEIVYDEVRDPVVLHIAVPRENDKTPLAAEQMFASLHGILRNAERSADFLSFEIVSEKDKGINFYAAVPRYLMKFVEGQIYAQYPNAEITLSKDYIDAPVSGVDPKTYQPYISTGEIELSRDFIFPIRTFRDFDVDPLAAITSALADADDGEQIMIQILIRPVANYWQDYAKQYIQAVRDGKDPTATASFWKSALMTAGTVVSGAFSIFMGSSSSEKDKAAQKPVVKLLPGQEDELTKITEKMAKVGFEVGLRIVTKALTAERSEQLLRDAIASYRQFTTANLNGFVHSVPSKTGSQMYDEFRKRFLSTDAVDVLNMEELASLYHLPNVSVETPNISWSRAKKAEPPINLPISDATIFAETDFRGKKVPFGIKRADRRLHFYQLGKTGCGKSTVFKNMIISDILAGDGVGVIDPHGELVEFILDFIPPNRLNDVVYINPADTEYPVGFNLLQLDNMNQRDLVADGVVEVFKKHFENSWGPRLQYILNNAILTALEVPGTTILAVQRMLVDRGFRKFIVKQVKDPVLKKFWEEEFATMETNSRLVTEAIAPIQNKVGRFLASSTIRNIVGQPKSTINLREIMDQKKIFLVNLSQGRLGEESSELLGGMIVTRLQSTAMERVDTPEKERKDFFLFVDEFQNYATESFAKILSEARKYRLCLHLTHQYIDQLPENVRTAIFGNVGTLASFVVGPSDATVLASEFAPVFAPEDLVAMEQHSMYLKLSIDGMISTPFSAKSLDVRYQRLGSYDKVVKLSREHYARPRGLVEEKIKKWTEQEYSKKGNRSFGESEEERNIVPGPKKFVPRQDNKVSAKPAPRPAINKQPAKVVKSQSHDAKASQPASVAAKKASDKDLHGEVSFKE